MGLCRKNGGLRCGGFLMLVGPSGCGKSTLLNTIAGLEPITSGEIRIAGRRVNRLHPSKRDIAMVFQSYALYPNMTVAQNVAFGVKIRGVPKPGRDKAVAEDAKTLQIGPSARPQADGFPAGNGSASPWAGRWCNCSRAPGKSGAEGAGADSRHAGRPSQSSRSLGHGSTWKPRATALASPTCWIADTKETVQIRDQEVTAWQSTRFISSMAICTSGMSMS